MSFQTKKSHYLTSMFAYKVKNVEIIEREHVRYLEMRIQIALRSVLHIVGIYLVMCALVIEKKESHKSQK